MKATKAIKTINAITGKYKKLASQLIKAADDLRDHIKVNNDKVSVAEASLRDLREDVAAENANLEAEAKKAIAAATSINSMVGEAA